MLQNYLEQTMLFTLVLTRITGLIMTAPIYGSRVIPVRVRAFIAIGLALMITPTQVSSQPVIPENLVDAVIILTRELILGLVVGMTLMILFSGLQLAGQIVGQVSGMALADVFDPTFETQVPIFTQLLDVITMSVFLAIGGHRQMLRALLDTFAWRPPGVHALPDNLLDVVIDVTVESFVMGIRAGAPVMVSLILAVLILGLISRTLPQLNVLAVGFSLNAFIMLGTFSLSVGAIAWLLQDRAEAVLDTVREVLITL